MLALLQCIAGESALCMTTVEPRPDPALQQLIEARAARFAAAGRALIDRQWAGLKPDHHSDLPARIYHYAHSDEMWGFSLSLFHRFVGDDRESERAALALARQWWSPALLALTLDQDARDMEAAERAARLLDLLSEPNFGRQSALLRRWIRPFYVELAAQPFPTPQPGQVLPAEGHGMVLAHMAAIAVDFERALAWEVADGLCDLDPEAQTLSPACVLIRQQMQRLNQGRLLFDPQPAGRNELLLQTVDDGCADYASYAQMMLLLLDAQDRSPLPESESARVLQQMLAICAGPNTSHR
jgi:hypothetical protein